MTGMLTRGLNLPLALGVGALGAWPFVLSASYELRVFTLAGIYALLVLG